MTLPGRSPLRYFGTVFVFVMLVTVQAYGSQDGPYITGIEIRPDLNEVELTVEGTIEYGYFPLSDPHRLVFDFPGATVDGGETIIEEVENAVFREVRLNQFSLEPPISRLVLYLDSPSNATVNFNPADNALVIKVNGEPEPFNGQNHGNSELIDLFASSEGNQAVEEEIEIEAAGIQDPTSVYEITRDETEVHIRFPGMTADQVRVSQLRFPDRLQVRIFTGAILDNERPRFDPLQRGNIWNDVGKTWTSFMDRDGRGIIGITVYLYPAVSYTQVIASDGTPEVTVFSCPQQVNEPEPYPGIAAYIESEEITEIEVANYPSDDTDDTNDVSAVSMIAANETVEVIENAVLGTEIKPESDTLIVETGNLSSGGLTTLNLPIRQNNLFANGLASGTNEALDMRVGEVVVLRVNELVRASMGNPQVATLNVISTEEVLITALTPGNTTLLVWESDGTYTTRAVTVLDATEAREEEIAAVIGDENISVSILMSGEAENTPGVILEGIVETEEERARAASIAALYAGERVTNLIEVSDPRQVLVKVRVVEINSRALDEHLSQFSAAARTNDDMFTIGIITDLLDPENPGGGLLDSRTRPGIFNSETTEDMVFDPIDMVLNELETNRQANVLSEPNVVGLSGHTAHFRVGGEIPYTYQNEQGINVVEFKEFGISLDMTPSVDSQGNIMLEIVPVVRTVDMALAIGGIPGFRTREMTTTVQLQEGDTLVIGGLIQNEISEVIAEVPFLSDIPVLGELFRSRRFTEDQTELVIFLTPYILDNPGQSRRLINIDPGNTE